MKYQDFVNLVKKRARVDSDEEANLAIRSTLKTLAERLYGNEADQLAAQLPPEVGAYLTQEGTKKDFDLDEFYEHVSERESIGMPMAHRHARAVISVLADTVTPGELGDVLDQLPQDYMELFTFGADGEWHDL